MTFIDFTDDALINKLLNKLQVEQRPLFGQMSPQHMVEHLSILISVSTGKRKVPQMTPAEKLPKLLAFLHSDNPLPVNFKAPFIKGLPPLSFPNLETAVDRLKKSIQDFKIYYDLNPQNLNIHPVFGPLNRPQWERFHSKHFTHHFRQFNLL